jgi:hypothetical protein
MIFDLTMSVFQRRCQIRINFVQKQMEDLIYSGENIVLKVYLRKTTTEAKGNKKTQNFALSHPRESNPRPAIYETAALAS